MPYLFLDEKHLKEAKAELIYKRKPKDTSVYNDFTLDTVVSYADAIAMYRCICNACEPGTRYFIENSGFDKKHKAKYSVKEVIELTKGQWNHDNLVRFFNKEVK